MTSLFTTSGPASRAVLSQDSGSSARAKSEPETTQVTPILAGCPPTTCTNCGKPDCDCQAPRQPGLVLDPFMGTGTTARVARRLGRDSIGIDLTREHFIAPTRADREAA